MNDVKYLCNNHVTECTFIINLLEFHFHSLSVNQVYYFSCIFIVRISVVMKEYVSLYPTTVPFEICILKISNSCLRSISSLVATAKSDMTFKSSQKTKRETLQVKCYTEFGNL